MDAPSPTIYVQPRHPDTTRSRWVVLGASVQGSGHLRLNIPCQDTYAHQIVDENTLIAVVADGLGSAANSQAGAHLAVSTAIQFLTAQLHTSLPRTEQNWIDVMRACFQRARARLEDQASADQLSLRDFATTLIAVVLHDDWIACAQIGDGAVVAALEDGTLELVSAPQNEEYANVTFPLTMPDMESAAQFTAWRENVQSLALMTDGMQYVSIRSADQSPHPPFFEPLFRQLPGVKDSQKASQNLGEFMASRQISAKTDDDKTLVLIGKQPDRQPGSQPA